MLVPEKLQILWTQTLQAICWTMSLQPAVSTPLPLRKSADAKVCPFGKSLLNICQSSDRLSMMVIVNGRAKGDEMGAYTCHISKGSSVVDYFITSSYGISQIDDCARALLGI